MYCLLWATICAHKIFFNLNNMLRKKIYTSFMYYLFVLVIDILLRFYYKRGEAIFMLCHLHAGSGIFFLFCLTLQYFNYEFWVCKQHNKVYNKTICFLFSELANLLRLWQFRQLYFYSYTPGICTLDLGHYNLLQILHQLQVNFSL